MPMFEITSIDDTSDRKYHNTREEAYTYLSRKEAAKFLNKIPKNGTYAEKMDAVINNVDYFSARMAEINSEIIEWIRPK